MDKADKAVGKKVDDGLLKQADAFIERIHQRGFDLQSYRDRRVLGAVLAEEFAAVLRASISFARVEDLSREDRERPINTKLTAGNRGS